MSVVAFCLLGVLLGGYVLLDGYDLGMGSLLLFVSRNEHERHEALESIAPFWNGNETWIIAAGGTLFAMFPQVYASAFSGFYLPFILLLWLLIGRGLAFELRELVEHPLWHAFWDVVFVVSSVLLIVLLGIALGNIVRGVPFEHSLYFLGFFAVLLNPYALGVALLALLALAQHGATYLLMRVEKGPVTTRSALAIARLFPAVVVCYVGLTAATFLVRPPSTFGLPAVAAIGVALSIAGLIGVRLSVAADLGVRAFHASSIFLVGLLLAAAATTYPYLLPGYPDPRTGLDIFRYAPNEIALRTALTATIIAIVLLAVYRTFLARRLTVRG
jgi:cytochrome d ubiquinol oxidase subunit II